jgi:uncharacterized protein DUF5335
MNIATIGIPRNDWPAYFNGLSVQYQGWRVMIEVLGRDLGDQPMRHDPPLQGISYETKGSEAGSILIEVGDTSDEYATHLIKHPGEVRVALVEPGGEVDMQFESEDGFTTLLYLRRPHELPPSRR